METIQYSLNNNYNDIFSNRSIRLNKNSKRDSLYNDNNVFTNNNNNNNYNLNNGDLNNYNLNNGNLYNKFDEHCVEVYGKKTCILFYTNNEKIQIRLLDNRIYKYFEDTEMYTKIPELLERLYTVVVVDKIKKTNSYEITAIHIPNK